MLHISFKDIVMCSILKVLTLHFFLSHTGFWTKQPLYCIRFVAAWKHKSFCLSFIAPVVYVKVSFRAIFYHSLVFLSCIFFQHEESIPYCLGFYILVRGESMCCSSFSSQTPCAGFFSSPSPLKKKERVFQYYNPCVSYKPSKFNYTSCVALLMVEHPLPCLYGDIPFGVNIDMSKWAVMDV